MENFVDKTSIVREIWGKSDTILFIFAGASAEFALNKAVDWLYFTGRLPYDPLRRLFSTVAYARQIIFSDKETALNAIDKMASLYTGIETERGAFIPNWAYCDVLYMLIDYSIRAYELLERKLTEAEKNEVYTIFHNVGIRMGLKDLPATYPEWEKVREEQLNQSLQKSPHTTDLYKQYQNRLGRLRYKLLLEVQSLIVPSRIIQLLQLNNVSMVTPALQAYKLSRIFNMDWLLKALILPPRYRNQINALDAQPS
jgi:hypothetical protein